MTPALTDAKLDLERDRLWHRTFDAIYDTLYNEIEVCTYIRRLEFLNTAALTMTFFTGGTGLATLIAKQTIWKTPGWEWVWVLLLVIAGLTEGLRRALDPAKKLPPMQQLVGELTHLKSNLEELRSIMLDPDFAVTPAAKQYASLTKRCTELTKKSPVSFLLHLRVRQKCQAETTARLNKYL